MTIRPTALKRRQPASRELADGDDRHAGDPAKGGQRTSLGAKNGVPALPLYFAEMDGEGKETGAGPIVAGCYSPPLQRKPLIFVALGGPAKTMDAPHWPGPLFF